MSIPQNLLDLITTAEDGLTAATAADDALGVSKTALTAAQEQVDKGAADALTAHQDANQKAAAAIAELKKHLGMT